MSSESLNSDNIKAEALRLGFFACGVAQARPVDPDTAARYRQWIASGGHADMNYLADNIDKRLDPTLLLPGARSIIVVAMNYAPARRIPDGEYQIAAYAYGSDYHDVLKRRLRQLGEKIEVESEASATEHADAHASLKVCVDTVPLLERYWAWQSGLGFIGRNHQLIIPHAGSMFFLGAIVTTLACDHYDSPMSPRCGTCHRCIDACPSGALKMADGRWKMKDSTFDSRKCLSYQTIENRGDIDEALKDKLSDSIYGCDRCQQACPWNRFAQPTDIPELQPREELLLMRRADWQQLTVEQYRTLFRGSAVKRAKYEGLMRNIRTVSHQPDGREEKEKTR